MEPKGGVLYISSKSWCNIREQLNKKQRQNRIVEKEKELKQTKRRLNEEMTKSWPDSKQNVRLRQEQERLQRIERLKQDRIENFYKMRKEQAEKRKEFVEKIKNRQYKSTDLPRQLNSALLLSACLYERDKQIEFKKFIQKQEDEANPKLNGRLFDDNEAEKRVKEKEQRAQYGDYLRQEISKNKNNEEMEYQKRIDEELIDNQRVNEEIEILTNRQIEKKRNLKAFYRQQYKEILQRKKELKEKEMIENQQIDIINDVYNTTKHRLDCLRKSKEEELRGNLEKRQDIIREKYIKIQQQQQQDDDARLSEQQKELFKKKEQQHFDKLTKIQQLKQQRIKDYEQYLDRVCNEKQINNQFKKWEMLNRFKNNEKQHESEQKLLQQKLERIQCYQRELFEQIASDKEAKQQELKSNSALQSGGDDDDNEQKFHHYANEVLEFARKHHFPIYPIEKVVREHNKCKK